MDKISLRGGRMRFDGMIEGNKSRAKKFFFQRLVSYLPKKKNILKYGHCLGGGTLLGFYNNKIETAKQRAEEQQQSEFIQLIEDAKNEWRFSMAMLSEATDPDIIDYISYLVKSNEAKYRYLMKIARREKISSALVNELKNS